MNAPARLALALLLPPGMALLPNALTGQSAPLPACEWCGTAEAPDDLDWRLTIAGDDEPGQRLVVRGVVYEADGETPAEGVILYLYHTNAQGVYPTRGDERGNGRRHGYLRGWLRTDERGRYEFRTIRPATYPTRTEPAHIHLTVQEPDGTREYWLDSFLFDGDPLLGPEDAGPHVLEPEESPDGVLHARRDIVLPAQPRR